MEIKSLLSALFLQLIADENYQSSEAFNARYDSDTIKEIANKQGYTDLVEKFEKLGKAYEGLDGASSEEEINLYTKQVEEIESEIENEI